MAVLAAMPSARAAMAVMVKPGVLQEAIHRMFSGRYHKREAKERRLNGGIMASHGYARFQDLC